jgi:hypothetical protein
VAWRAAFSRPFEGVKKVPLGGRNPQVRFFHTLGGTAERVPSIDRH